MRGSRRRAVLAVTLSFMALTAGCGDDDGAADPGPTRATSSTTAAEADVEEPSSTTAPSPTGITIEVSVTDGEVTGGGRHEVSVGEPVTLRVTSDVADHVHVHGYDLIVDVQAGETAQLAFDATIPGVFEVELEDARIPLLELEVA